MSTKVFNVFSILCFALVLCFMGCTELINPKTVTDINLNIDLSKIIKSTRNTEETQSSASIGENPTIKVAIYDAKKYNATTNSTDNLDLITEAQAQIVDNEAKVKLNNIPVGIYAIVFAELSFTDENSTEVMYAGNSEVFKVKASDNEIRLVLKKVGNSETYPDNTNTPYEISSWGGLVDLVTKINSLSDVSTTTEFIIMNDLIATCTITVSKPVKIIAKSPVTITRYKEFSGTFFVIDTGSLELGSEENKIILDGGNQNNINATDPLIWECSTGQDLTLTNCTLQYNTLNNTDGFGNGGAVYVSGGTFTMNNSSIIKCSANENGGAVYVTDKGTFNMNGGSIAECFATSSGGGVCMDNGSSFTMFGGKIDGCHSNFEGGGVYVAGENNLCTFEMLDSTIIGCSAENGGGICLYGKLTMKGGAYVDSFNDNDVYLASGTTVTVAGELTYDDIVATITPFDYKECIQVLTADDTDLLAQSVGKFALSSSEDGPKYVIDTNGNLALVSQNYAEGLTCEVDSVGIVTLYIRNADGLAKFRDIVNGSFDSDIIVVNDSNQNSNHKFTAKIPYPSVNGTLRDPITLSGDWTPIGVYSNTTTAKPYSGTFDGNGKTITFDSITHGSTETYSSGLFQMLAGTVKNLIIDGSISRTDTGYIGGITGYLDGGTIENCVNNATITNSASNGTGGIVGYVGTAGGIITGCINLGNISSKLNAVGGIVGATGVISETSNVSISKCINMGEISALSIVAGILGLAYPITIENCINLGKVISTKEDDTFYYAAGIVIPSDDVSVTVTVTNCINAGNVVTSNSCIVGAISTSENGIYTNNYYDSTVNSSVVVDSNTDGISGVSTTDLIGSSSNLSLQGITTDNWSFADGRYPLPNIAGNIPEQIWTKVEAAATPDSSSVSGGEPIV